MNTVFPVLPKAEPRYTDAAARIVELLTSSQTQEEISDEVHEILARETGARRHIETDTRRPYLVGREVLCTGFVLGDDVHNWIRIARSRSYGRAEVEEKFGDLSVEEGSVCNHETGKPSAFGKHLWSSLIPKNTPLEPILKPLLEGGGELVGKHSNDELDFFPIRMPSACIAVVRGDPPKRKPKGVDVPIDQLTKLSFYSSSKWLMDEHLTDIMLVQEQVSYVALSSTGKFAPVP